MKTKIEKDKLYKYIDRIKHKLCNRCFAYFPANNDYFYANNKNGADGLYPYCIKCNKDKTKGWRKDNPDKHRVLYLRRNATEVNQKSMREAHKKRVEAGEYREWQRNNPDKSKKYREDYSRKKHEISQDEWDACRLYFNYRCAYCGMTWEDHKKKNNKDLNKEHNDDNGANDLSNCIPSCTPCNSSKWEFSFEEWYNESNPNFTEERFNKIMKWLNHDYKLYIQHPIN